MRCHLSACVLMIAVQSGPARGSDFSFSAVAAEYVAGSIEIRCELKVTRAGRYSFRCGEDEPFKGTAVLAGVGRISLSVPIYGSPSTLEPVMPRAPRDSAPPSWPPSLEDPTAPLIASETVRLERMTLVLLRWGPRRYLVRHDSIAEFCRSIAEGVEPRTAEVGWEFLRTGDHRKRVGKSRPTECTTLSE